MAWRLASLIACVGLLAGCQVAAAPDVPVPTAAPSAVTLVGSRSKDSTPAALATLDPSGALRTPTVPPTPVPPTRVATPRPTLAPTLAPTATPALPRPTPNATQIAQQGFCDIAAPPAHLPLPVVGPFIRITPADVATQPTPTAGGPQKQSSDAPPPITAPNVAILDDASGNLLYAQDAFSRHAPASITKIATTIVALERGPDIKTMFSTTVNATLASD